MSKGYDLPEEDDGETIVNMDVDGMPWHDRAAGTRSGASPDDGREFSKEEVRAYRAAAIKASLLVVAVFAIVFGAFIAFCDFVLFR